MKRLLFALLALMLAFLLVLPAWAAVDAQADSDAPAADISETETATVDVSETEAGSADASETEADSANAPETDATPEPIEIAVDDFNYLKPARRLMIKYYTAIQLPAFEHTLYAFNDKDGVTQFRVYGNLKGAKRGFYKAEVTAAVSDNAAGWDFEVAVTGTKPVKDAKVFALYKGKDLAKDDIPEGFRKGTGKGMYYFFNLFGKKESIAWASADGENYAWYLANGNRPLAGSLEVDADAMFGRMHQKDAKYYRLPKDLSSGYGKEVVILTTDGKTAVVLTNKPPIVKADLKER